MSDEPTVNITVLELRCSKAIFIANNGDYPVRVGSDSVTECLLANGERILPGSCKVLPDGVEYYVVNELSLPTNPLGQD